MDMVELVRSLRASVAAVVSLPELTGLDSVKEVVDRVTHHSASLGTAFAITPDSFLSCHHVVANVKPSSLKLCVWPESGGQIEVHEVLETKCDPQLDIALMNTKQVEARPLCLHSGSPRVGLDILAVGYPFSEQQSPEFKSESHINVNIHHTFRAIRGIIASRLVDGRFEIDKHVNHGQSGGPIVSVETGEVEGMCRAFIHFPEILGEGEQKKEYRMPAELSVGIPADLIRKRLREWGKSV